MSAENKKKKYKREAGRQGGTPRLSQQRPFRKEEFNPSKTNTESHKIYQTNVWEGNQKGNKSMKQMVNFVMCHFTKIGSDIVPSPIVKGKKK